MPPTTTDNVCNQCFNKTRARCEANNNTLVKVGDHFVPWRYHHCPLAIKKPIDVYAIPPTIDWCDKHHKIKLSFHGADVDGRIIEKYTWYFDNVEALIRTLSSK